MLFSLIVPVFNTGKYLNQCLESIEKQDFDDYEIIIVDDGSTDESPRICDEFCEKINNRTNGSVRARAIHQSNEGLAGARNRGIKEAKGDWLWFIDSDDFIATDALKVLCERMRFAKGDLYAFQYAKTDESGNITERVIFRTNQENFKIKNEGDLLWYYSNRFFNYSDGWEAWNRLYKREIIEKNNLCFKDTKQVFAEDLCFATEYMLCISDMVFLVNALYYYRQRKDSIMGSLKQQTILVRLINLLEDVYLEARKHEKKKVCWHFDSICYELLSDHIKYKLWTLTDEEISASLKVAYTNKTIGRFIKRHRLKLFTDTKRRQKTN